MRRWWVWIPPGLGLLLLSAGLFWAWHVQHLREGQFDGEIRLACEQYAVDPALVKAVIWKESRFNPLALGRAGEIGLMQIRELAAVDWSTSQGVIGFKMGHLKDPKTNILAGTWYLARLLKRYRTADDPTPYALADYNSGRSNVRKWIKGDGADTNAAAFIRQIAFPSTRQYVQAVMERRSHYR